MEAGIVVVMLVSVVVGVLVGILIGRAKHGKTDTQGVIYVYYGSADEKPSLLLDYDVPIEDIASHKLVTFYVNVIK